MKIETTLIKRYQIFLITFFLFLPSQVRANLTRGIYGIPAIKKLHPSKYVSQLKRAEINAVFVPADGETIRWFKEHGFKVYLSVNAFGGKGAWKRYPDSRPVKADGRLLGSEPGYKGYGGVCPTHQIWRGERLKYIEKLVKQFGGEEGIDGIWLDFIRYPGRWEVKDPEIPDTCYCQRCLKKFQEDSQIALPEGLRPGEAAGWIENNCAYEWMKWKKEQISSFVAQVREILGHLKLGLFLVPWTRGERQNAISFRLAQDAFQLSRQVDVISPMVYHKMCGQPEIWVGYMTRYYKETAHCQVWPIVQSSDCGPEEFARVLQFAGRADADGVLTFSFKGIKPDQWDSFKVFQRPANLITNPELIVTPGNDRPVGWKTGKSKSDNIKKSAFFVKPSDKFHLRKGEDISGGEVFNFIGITAGNDRSGVWFSPLPDCEPGYEYLFTCRLYRKRWINGVYPIISLWGEEFYVNNHWRSRTFQLIRLYVTCPEKSNDLTFRFMNHNPGETFWLSRPRLTKNYSFPIPLKHKAIRTSFYKDFFPIGVYGARMNNLEHIKKLAVNTVLIGGRGESLKKTVLKCHKLGLRYVISIPRDPDRLHIMLNHLAEYVRPPDLAFYVNDEPGIRSFPINKANDLNRLIKDSFPGSATCMAVVRPQVCRDYLNASDFFMLDQYPIPNMPMTWLSDSMDQARKDVGSNRLASVIQAFGGENWKNAGWPRMPTWEEMDCLSFLSIVHGSRGIFFFTFDQIGKTEKGRERLGRVVGRLNRLYPWLKEENLDYKLQVKMVSDHRVDPKGRPAIHCCLKKKGDKLLLIAVNAIRTYVEAVIQVGDLGVEEFKEVFRGVSYPVVQGGLRAKFKPFETKAFVARYRMKDAGYRMQDN